MKFVVSRPASRDLAEIGGWIARDDARAADRIVARLRECCEFIARFPEAFAIYPEFAEQQVRHRTFRRYLIFYRVHTDRVVIIAVMHGARDVAAVLRQRLN